MNKKQRQYRRAVANGEVYTPKRKPAMPSPMIIQLNSYGGRTIYKHDR